MRLIIISGLSGSGKSVALNTLEDEGFYCIDNIPPGLLLNLLLQLKKTPSSHYHKTAIGIDARADSEELRQLPAYIGELREYDFEPEVLFFHASNSILIKRFSETRRKHPLSHDHELPLKEAIKRERDLLGDMQDKANLSVDTTELNVYALRSIISSYAADDETRPNELTLLFQSFGFKHGLPNDTDFLFDVRCLPNPFWDPKLKRYNGLDKPVIDFLEHQPDVNNMFTDIKKFVDTWLPKFQAESRRYMTISIGCTGGQHRSVYLAEQLAQKFAKTESLVLVRHRELSQQRKLNA